MHDAFGRELKVGDVVVVPFEVVDYAPTSSEFCNVNLKSLATMPGNGEAVRLSAINTKQMIRANGGDRFDFVTIGDDKDCKLFPNPATNAAAAPPRRDPRNPVLRYFDFEHLPPALQEVSRPFCELARKMAATNTPSAELSVALRKLLEAKDAAVRASLPAES